MTDIEESWVLLQEGEHETEGEREVSDEYEGAHAFSMENLLRLKLSLPRARFGWLLLGVLLSVPCRVNLERYLA